MQYHYEIITFKDHFESTQLTFCQDVENVCYSTVDISLKTNMRSLNSVLIAITVISTHDKRQINHQNLKIVFGTFYLQTQDK